VSKSKLTIIFQIALVFLHCHRSKNIDLSSKPRIEQLRANVKAQEIKLEQVVKMLGASKKKAKNEKDQSKTLRTDGSSKGQTSEWDALEKVIGLMDHLLTSYRRYSFELEKIVARLEVKGESPKRVK
jgi:hypothetical protein